jgi:U3 small nucleolar RNA-associated protein 20
MGMQDIALKLCSQLKSEHLDAALSLQVVKNLFYVGKCFYAMPAAEDLAKDDKYDEGAGEDSGNHLKQPNPLAWLFSKLSYQTKSAHIARRNRSFGLV